MLKLRWIEVEIYRSDLYDLCYQSEIRTHEDILCLTDISEKKQIADH